MLVQITRATDLGSRSGLVRCLLLVFHCYAVLGLFILRREAQRDPMSFEKELSETIILIVASLLSIACAFTI